MTVLAATRVFDGQRLLTGQAVVIEGNRIAAVLPVAEAGPVTRLNGILAPGFLDLQVNGGGGLMVGRDTDAAALRHICATHQRLGCAGVLPTLITDTSDTTAAVIAAGIHAVRTSGFLGLHLEGPHLDPRRHGAHDPALIRPGIGLYGGLPFADAQPVVRLSLPVIQTRTVQAGEFVGYSATWTAHAPRRIATVAAGYADGILRSISSRGASLYAGGTACPIVGRVSMDLMTVDVTDLDNVPGELDLICPQQPVDRLADHAGTIGYEILTSLGHRYDRIYR